MNLVQFIQNETEQIIKDWRKAALEITPGLEGVDQTALEDHAREMLQFIVLDLETSQSSAQSARKAMGKGRFVSSLAAEGHGSGRQLQGLSLIQMIQELRALRARILHSWGEVNQGLSTGNIYELSRFNEAIDQLIVDSALSYSDGKEKETRLLDAMLSASPDPEAIFAPDGRLMFLNSAMADLANTTIPDALNRNAMELDLGFRNAMHDAIIATVTTGQNQRQEFHHYFPSGQEMFFDSQFVPVFNDQNEIEAVAKASRDITERKQSEYQIWRSANFDLLTGLPNRRLFLDRLEQTRLEAERNESSFALIFLDLDRFKQTNDELGHNAGDKLLVKVANRISKEIRAMDTAARIGGDEFTVILKDTGREGAKEAAKGILNSLEQGFDIASHRLYISCSIGLSVFPDDDRELDKLMHDADLAMYVAKSRKDQHIQAYEPWMVQSESEHTKLNTELDDALAQGQLEVYYQPIIDIRTRAIAGAEALVRWNHPSEGLLTPGAFLRGGEQRGMTEAISAYVLEQAVRCSFRWRCMDDKPFSISVNESPIFFLTKNLVDQWRARLESISLDESWIILELSSASFKNITASSFNPVKSLGSRGFKLKLAINNFDIDPSPLAALQKFRVDSIKISRELIESACHGDEEAHSRMQATIAMAHEIGVKVIGVGVENKEQLECISNAGCDLAQGFLFSKPLPQDDFEALLNKDPLRMAS